MAKQGKCWTCKIHYSWKQETRLNLLACQKCGNPLTRTARPLGSKGKGCIHVPLNSPPYRRRL